MSLLNEGTDVERASPCAAARPAAAKHGRDLLPRSHPPPGSRGPAAVLEVQKVALPRLVWAFDACRRSRGLGVRRKGVQASGAPAVETPPRRAALDRVKHQGPRAAR